MCVITLIAKKIWHNNRELTSLNDPRYIKLSNSKTVLITSFEIYHLPTSLYKITNEILTNDLGTQNTAPHFIHM